MLSSSLVSHRVSIGQKVFSAKIYRISSVFLYNEHTFKCATSKHVQDWSVEKLSPLRLLQSVFVWIVSQTLLGVISPATECTSSLILMSKKGNSLIKQTSQIQSEFERWNSLLWDEHCKWINLLQNKHTMAFWFHFTHLSQTIQWYLGPMLIPLRQNGNKSYHSLNPFKVCFLCDFYLSAVFRQDE